MHTVLQKNEYFSVLRAAHTIRIGFRNDFMLDT